jgi:hypothetical protein
VSHRALQGAVRQIVSLESEGIVDKALKGYAEGNCHNSPTLGKYLVKILGLTIDLPLEKTFRVYITGYHRA